MKEIPWLTEVLTTLETDGVPAAEAVLERALAGATLEERAEVGLGWAEVLVAERRPLEAIALLDLLIASAPSPELLGKLWWRQARLLASTGHGDRVAQAAEEALRLGKISDAARIQVAADAVASVDPARQALDVAGAHAILLGTLTRSPTPTTRADLLEVAWTMAGPIGEAARARGERELEAWSALLMSLISGMMDQLDGAILLARHAADAAVEGESALAYSEAVRGLARWVVHRDGHEAGGETLQEAQRTWDAHFADVVPNPIAEWISAWPAAAPEAGG